MKKLILPVFVTDQDIKRGVCAKPMRCPAALGLKRAVKNRFRDTITGLRVHVIGEDGMHVMFDQRGKKDSHQCYDMYRVPQKVLDFINKFDETHGVRGGKKTIKPITFQFRGVEDAA